MKKYGAIICRDIRLTFFRGSEGVAVFFFFVIVASLFPFAFDGSRDMLRTASVGIIWVSALLASLLSLESVYHRDFDDGTFDLLFMSSLSPIGIALAKMAAHWVVSGLPLLVAASVVSQMLFFPAADLPMLLLSLLIGTLYMSLLGGAAAALTMGSRRPGVLLAVIALPLYVPMLVLGIMMVKASLLLQMALLVAALPLMPLAAASFLKASFKS